MGVARATSCGKSFLSIAVLSLLSVAPTARAAMAPGFQEAIVFSGLKRPTNVRFAPDGRAFVAEKSGVIKVFRSLQDTAPVVFADLSANVMDQWDRGLLGIALDPTFPARPYVYVLYDYDAPPGQTAPVWNDKCDDPEGVGCTITARLSRLEVGPANTMVGAEKVLVENRWCMQYPSHSIGDLAFGPDGALYVSAGDGASFSFEDRGQTGGNPCGDAPGLGGAFRAQSVLTGQRPASFDGTIVRVDPDTGAARPNGPLSGGTPDDDGIVAFGLRNPFRFGFRPGTRELWIADVGWNTTEEIDVIADTTDAVVENFGWPCYEGAELGYSYSGLPFCTRLSSSKLDPGVVTSPLFAYRHGAAPGPACTDCDSASVSGVAFYQGTSYPAAYQGALFFCDYARKRIWAMPKGPTGAPSPAASGGVITVSDSAPDPVALQAGPLGDIFYVNHGGDQGAGDVRRLFVSQNRIPIANAAADVTAGAAPLVVHFSAAGSSDPDGAIVAYAWDLDGDGAFDDSTAAAPVYTYARSGVYRVGLRVTDGAGATGTAAISILVDSSPPVPEIVTPGAGTTWRPGDVITFSGRAADKEDGALLAPSLDWSIVLMHCPSDCHPHALQDFDNVTGGKVTAPDHDYPCYLQLRLTATDSSGLTETTAMKLMPETSRLRFETDPPGLDVVVGSASRTAPFELPVITGSLQSISAPAAQMLGPVTYVFAGWSDGGPLTHDIRVTAPSSTFKAQFVTTSRPAEGDGIASIAAIAAPESSSCGCRTPPRHASRGVASAGLVVAALFAWRRTRARCSAEIATRSRFTRARRAARASRRSAGTRTAR